MITTAAFLALGTACTGAAVVLWAHRRSHPVTVVLAAVAGAMLLAAGWSVVDLAAGWQVVRVVLALGVPLLVACYPEGLPRTAGERVVAALTLLSGVLVLARPAGGSDVLAVVAGWSLCSLLLGTVWWRTETSTGDVRRALTWLALGVAAPGLVAGQVAFLADSDDSRTTAAVVAVVVVVCLSTALTCLVVGMVAPRLLDVRRLASQAARYAVSGELTVALFVGVPHAVAAAGGSTMSSRGTTVLALALAVVFHPVSLAVQRVGDELLGGRTDPVAVMTTLGAELEAGGAPGRWVVALRVALGVPWVQLWAGGALLAESTAPAAGPRAGAPSAGAARVPLRVGEDDVGALVVAVPPDDTSLAPEVRTVLGLVAPPLAQALQGLALTAELSDQRAQALGALEEERRRLRRDLHDGLGPVLTGIAYSADAARNLVASDPEEAVAILAALREDTASTITEIRRLVTGLRPPALDERGLAGAVLQRVERLHCVDGRPLTVEVTTRGRVQDLPAAVEVAAYRIAVEALTNTARHARPPAAGARDPIARVEVEAGAAEVVVTVTETGTGAGSPWVPGVGLTSMRERCEQLHGHLDAGPGPDGGVVRAVLPLPAPAGAVAPVTPVKSRSRSDQDVTL